MICHVNFSVSRKEKKLIHTVGVVSQGKLTITNNPLNYTGIFASGADNIIIRMSTAQQPTSEGGNVTFLPALVIKYLRDGVPSANSFAMFSLLGQNSYNFFKHDLSNHVPIFGPWAPTAQQLVLDAFLAASSWPTMIGLSDMASWDQLGNHATSPRFPYRLVFHPADKWHNYFPDSYPGMPYNEQLSKALSPGLLYTIYAQDQPPFSDNSQLIKIGTVDMTTGSMSHFGDRTLFMAHTRFENDLDVFPNWEAGAQQDIDNQKNTTFPGFLFPDLPWGNSSKPVPKIMKIFSHH